MSREDYLSWGMERQEKNQTKALKENKIKTYNEYIQSTTDYYKDRGYTKWTAQKKAKADWEKLHSKIDHYEGDVYKGGYP